MTRRLRHCHQSGIKPVQCRDEHCSAGLRPYRLLLRHLTPVVAFKGTLEDSALNAPNFESRLYCSNAATTSISRCLPGDASASTYSYVT